LNACGSRSFSPIAQHEIAQQQYLQRVTSSLHSCPLTALFTHNSAPSSQQQNIISNLNEINSELDSYAAIINQFYAIPLILQQSIREDFIVCMSAALSSFVHYSVRQNQSGMLKGSCSFFLQHAVNYQWLMN